MLTQERPKGSKPVLFVLDEVDLLGYMSALEEARDRGRKYGISLMLLYQSVGQLEKHFSKESATAWFDSAAIVSYAAIKSPETAKRVSEQCGETTVEVEGSSTQSSWRDGVFPSLSPQGRNTRSISLQKRPLILPHEVRQMRSDEQIVLVRGKPALRCGRAIYFRRPEMLDGSRHQPAACRMQHRHATTPGQQLVLDEQAERLAIVKAAGQVKLHCRRRSRSAGGRPRSVRDSQRRAQLGATSSSGCSRDQRTSVSGVRNMAQPGQFKNHTANRSMTMTTQIDAWIVTLEEPDRDGGGPQRPDDAEAH